MKSICEYRKKSPNAVSGPKRQFGGGLLGPQAEAVLKSRYLARDGAGEVVEDADGLFRRVAGAVARAEAEYGPAQEVDQWAERFHEAMTSLRFLPNSPTLMNAGRPMGQLSACFVLPVADSIPAIFTALKQAAIIHQSGGGTGFSFSRLRPAGDEVKSTHGVSSGPVSFMRVFDLATETIKQGGARRGANMGLLRVDHPDILEFIAAKEGPGLANFNLSVIVTDDFMAALDRGEDYDLVNPRTGRAQGRLAAEAVFDRLTAAAQAGGEPGVVFIDQINRANPTPHLGPIEATNPCGEQPLLAYESCNLGSINLAAFVSSGRLNWAELAETVDLAVRFLDDVITVNRYPLARIAKLTLANRKIGLGVMGLADLFIELGLDYAGPAAEAKAAEITAFIQNRARLASISLGRSRGLFPNWPGSRWAQEGLRPRNATLTTIAPTGTLSIIAGTSSGIEPLYGLAVSRDLPGGRREIGLHPALVREAEAAGLGRDLIDRAARAGRIGHLAGFPDWLKQRLATAHEIHWSRHLAIQAACQRWTDNAVSKTINLPTEAGVDQVAAAIRAGYRLGLKGLTVYRDHSRPGQVLTLGPDDGDCPVCGPSRG